MPKPKQADRPTGRDETVDAAVRAAADQLADLGPARMTIRTVADAASVNHALIHRHLETKDRLISAALDLLAEECHAEVQGWLDEGLSALWLSSHPKTHRYILALSRCIVEQDSSARPTRFPVLEQMAQAAAVEGLDETTSRARAVALLCVVFGTELFATVLSDAIGLGEDDRHRPVDLLDGALRLLDQDLNSA